MLPNMRSTEWAGSGANLVSSSFGRVLVDPPTGEFRVRPAKQRAGQMKESSYSAKYHR